MQTSRRQFLQMAGASTVAMIPIVNCTAKVKNQPQTVAQGWKRLNLGMTSYTLRKFSLSDAIAMTKRVGIEYISLKSMHMPLESSVEEIQNIANQVRAAGLNLYGAGVIYMKTEEEVKQAFAYAQAAELKVIIGVPNHELLSLCNELVKKYNIKLAIHNHGPEDKLYPSPESVYTLIKNLDTRIGLCIDIGHTMRGGNDPAIAAERFADRLIDVHIKDVTEATKNGKTVEIGRGVIDIPKFLRTLLKIKFAGVVALEFEKDAMDPLAGMAESIGFLKGVLTVI